MKRLLAALLISILTLSTSQIALAEEAPLDTLEEAGIVVAVEAPEASAEALLKLPNVYALPGTFSYWVNQIIDEIRLIFTSDPEDRANLLLEFSAKRLAEGYEAVKSGKAEAALTSLQRYQEEQHDLATSLYSLQTSDVDVAPYLDRLSQQLGIQQSLQEYVEQEKLDEQIKDEISQLLEISPVQRLAWQQYNQSALLGEKTIQKQASPSASPSAEPKER